MLRLAQELSLVADVFHTVRVTTISTQDVGAPVDTPFTGPMLAASIVQGYFSMPLPLRWDETISGDPEVLAARAAMVSQLPTALEDAAQRSAIAVSSLRVISHWPRFSYGPNQRSALARLMIGSRRADVALFQEVDLLAKAEIARQPAADTALVAEYLDGIRKMWDDGPLPRNAAAPSRRTIVTLPALPCVPDTLTTESVDAWITEAFAVIKPSLIERAVGGLVSADLDAAQASLGMDH